MRKLRLAGWLLLVFLSLWPSHAPAEAEPLQVEITGVEPAVADNIRAHLATRWASGAALSRPRLRQRWLADVEQRVFVAMRPFGYYQPEIMTRVSEPEEDRWLLEIQVSPGPPVRVREVQLSLQGPGAELGALRDWRRAWPLQQGARLDQRRWETEKESAIEIAHRYGYLEAAFDQAEIRLDLDRQEADLVLVLATGRRAVFGEVEFVQDLVEVGVLRAVPRFEQGQPYSAWLVDALRTDLWKTGYFEDIVVSERPRLEREPPAVDLLVTLGPRLPNTQQATVGYGSDTEFRFQYRWQRHVLSGRGDSVGAGVGWQQRYDEANLFTEYRLPRQRLTQQYWLANSQLRTESRDVILTDASGGDPVSVGSGRIEALSLRGGIVTLRAPENSREQIVETVYAEYLLERDNFDNLLQRNFGAGAAVDQPGDGNLGERTGSLSIGVLYDWPVIEGRGFQTYGHHERAWLFTSNEAWGSDREFTQAYLSSRWNILFGDRWKLLLRGEVGYTDAAVDEYELDVGDRVLQLSVTELPNRYRFRTGGSQTVRGYDFETLSNNGLGSNNVLTASAELEFNFHGDWSAAVFYDVGNAFNQWSQRDLKAGAGVGLRWYTLAGALRIDYAQALDLEGRPWQIHFTIGTPLL